MIETIYIEEAILQHPRVDTITARFPQARIITCSRYGEVFNPKAQNFRLQKQKPALILAEKYKNFALPAPSGYGIGATRNYYFSHMLNCLYDCRYCFLQGMYQSANYVLFVNYEDFQDDIGQLCAKSPAEDIHFFSGYDCDSLALEPVSGFAEQFLPFFEQLANAWLELRTKSTQVRSLLNREPLPRCIVAFSLNPDEIATKTEAKAPSIPRRLEAMAKLQEHGWLLGLRFDPVIYQTGCQEQYQRLFEQVFSMINLKQLHSVSLGVFRLPESYFKKVHKLYPDEKLFAGPLANQQGMISYKQELEQEMMHYCTEQLLSYIPEAKFFPCAP
ncbi:Spore photoproduct lyase [Candidatus Methylobacter favarea]|uniref:Spore photoproduct lyase n=1 Tax=Candidatus Methylobacter favarea TaxID=2707345 RepID=A0A8S0XIN5_9GAMM|nr:DNA photolyase [Candidatus Methylobacter favarea]CAA9890946.1 Spore photoproduct lyase [Candidatus Methylobacter favarea]